MTGHADLAAFVHEGRIALLKQAGDMLRGGLDPRLDAYLGRAPR